MWIGLGECRPGCDPFIFDLAADQLVTHSDGSVLAMLLVAGADPLTLAVIHQRQVEYTGEGALVELDRGPGIHHRHIIKKYLAVVAAVVAHHSTSTA